MILLNPDPKHTPASAQYKLAGTLLVLLLLTVSKVGNAQTDAQEQVNPEQAATIVEPTPVDSAQPKNQHSAYNSVSLSAGNNNFSARFDQALEPFQIAILGFYNANMHFNAPALLDAIHHSLPMAGWQALSFSLSGTETDQVQQLKAGTGFLEERNAESLALISIGETANLAMELSIEQKDYISGLVLWQVANELIAWEQLDELLASRVSILDIVPPDLSKQALQIRQHRFKLAGFTEYYQLIQVSDAAPAAIPAKRIRAWLSNNFEK